MAANNLTKTMTMYRMMKSKRLEIINTLDKIIEEKKMPKHKEKKEKKSKKKKDKK